MATTKKTAAKKAAKKPATPEETKWVAVVRGTAQVRLHFEVEADTEDEAQELADNCVNFGEFSLDECEFFEVRFDDEVTVSKK